MKTGGKTMTNPTRHQQSSPITRGPKASTLMRTLMFLAVCVLVVFADLPNASAKLAGNKLAGNKLAGNTLAGNKLASNSLSTDGVTINQLAANDLLATEDGRQVLEYLLPLIS